MRVGTGFHLKSIFLRIFMLNIFHTFGFNKASLSLYCVINTRHRPCPCDMGQAVGLSWVHRPATSTHVSLWLPSSCPQLHILPAPHASSQALSLSPAACAHRQAHSVTSAEPLSLSRPLCPAPLGSVLRGQLLRAPSQRLSPTP